MIGNSEGGIDVVTPILIIDPGHGGTDPGGGTNSLWKEKNLVLQISLYQEKRFQQLGLPVVLTRRTDVTLEPADRAEIVRESGAKYAISNHINSGGGDGAETIHSIYSNGKLARLIVEEIKERGQNIRRVFTRTLPGDASKDYYYMHRLTGGVETVIVEYGFADSPKDDVSQLQNHWKRYAEAVVEAFCAYIDHPYAPPQEVRSTEPAALPEIQEEIGIIMNGVQVGTGYLIQNTSFIPARLLVDLFGVSVGWDGENVILRNPAP
jgi:N-acetylmuramoyl-L-alanine amidase